MIHIYHHHKQIESKSNDFFESLYAMFICWKVIFFFKVNYFLIFSSVMRNKLKNNFQCLIMS